MKSIYNFGPNHSGIRRLHISREQHQCITMSFAGCPVDLELKIVESIVQLLNSGGHPAQILCIDVKTVTKNWCKKLL